MSYKKSKDLQKTRAILKIRATALAACRSWLNSQDFTEVQGPVLLPAVGERPRSFEVNYFGKKAFLSEGLQPYSDSFMEMFGQIYTVAPAFRAEPLKDNRHLAEFWRIEAATLNSDLPEIMCTLEGLVSNCCSVLVRDNAEELSQLSRLEDLLLVKPPFSRITYDEAVELLRKSGCLINWGEPLSREFERKLSLMFVKPFFVREFPVGGENFLFKSSSERPELSLCADLLAPGGLGEIAGCGEAIMSKKDLVGKLKEMQVETADRRWFLGLRRFGDCPESGFSVGVERLVQWLCGLQNVGDAVAFPRVYGRSYV